MTSPSSEFALSNVCFTCRNLNGGLRFEFQDDEVYHDLVFCNRTLHDLHASVQLSCRYCSIVLQVINHFSPNLSISESFEIRLSEGTVHLRLPGILRGVEIYSPPGKLNIYLL
jgi:hypothetical protein